MIDTPQVRREALTDRHPVWIEQTVSEAFDAAVTRYAGRPFVITDERVFTYSQIQAWSLRLAGGLAGLGLGPGDNVAIILANYPEVVALRIAMSRVGATSVPINFNLRAAELAYVLRQSDAQVLITMDTYRGHDFLADLDNVVTGWEAGSAPAAPMLRHVFVFRTGEAPPRQAPLFEGLGADDVQQPALPDAADPHATSDILFTSGTTGSPKGVMLSHDMLLRAAYSSAYTRALEDGRRIAFALPMYHVFGYVECVLSCMFVGGAVVPRLSFDPVDLLGAAERHSATEIACVPAMTLKLLEVADTRGFTGELAAVFNSGGPNSPSIWTEIRRLLRPKEIATAYGMTETSASTTCTLPEEDDRWLSSSNGRMKPACVAGESALGGRIAMYKTIDPETGADLPAGQTGEFVVRGPVVTRGYYNKPDETAAAFTSDGWLRTGDVGRIDHAGYLTLTGRSKETYRCGGELVMPREVETLYDDHPLIAQAIVVGVPDGKMGEVGCVCVVPRTDVIPSAEEIIAVAAARLARFKVPRHVLVLTANEVPLTVTGRPQKFKLAKIAQERLAQAPTASAS